MNDSTLVSNLTGSRPKGPRGLHSEEGLEEVERLLQRLALGERVDRLGTMVREHLGSGGKRLRARLALAAAEALGLDRRAAVPWAAACEMLHNATLIHDDIQDGDRHRRGTEAVWARYGAAQAINAGDLCLVLPALALEGVPDIALRWTLLRGLTLAAVEVVRGQCEELELLSSRRLTWQAWSSAAAGKTAALFSLPVWGAAVLAGHTEEQAARFAEAFRPLGLMFQLQDDVLDLFGDKGRGAPGADLRAGRVSALVVEHLSLHPEDEEPLVSLLRAPPESTLPEHIQHWSVRFREAGSLRQAWERITSLEDLIFESDVLAPFPRFQALACDLSGRALAPIAHTAPVSFWEVSP